MVPSPRPRSRHWPAVGDTGALVLLALGLIGLMAAYWHGPLTKYTYMPIRWVSMDPLIYYMPNYALIGERWRSGSLPLWNPYQMCGTPLVPLLQGGIFYPGNILYVFLPVHIAYPITVMFHVGLGGWFAGWYAKRRGCGLAGMCAAAIAASLGAAVLSFWSIWAATNALPWIFACLIALDALFERPGARPAVMLAGALALHFLAGWPQTTVMAVYALGLRAAWWLVCNRRQAPAPVRTLGWIACAAGLWLALVGIQFLPSAAHLQEDAARSLSGIPEDRLAIGIQYSWTGLVGDLLDAVPTVRVKRTYIGLMGLVLVFASWGARGRRREVAFWWGLWMVFLLFLLGFNGPVYALYTQLPTGRLFREPTRFAYLVHTAACMLVALGADVGWGWLCGLARARKSRLAAGLTLAALVSCAVVVHTFDTPTVWQSLGAAGPLAEVAYPWLIYFALGAGAIAVAARFPNPRVSLAVGVVLAAIWVADCFYANRNAYMLPHEQPAGWYTPAQLGISTTEGVAGPRVYIRSSFKDAELPPKWGTLTGMPQVDDYEVFHVMREPRFFHFLALGKPGPPWFYSPGRHDIGTAPAHPELLSLMSVRWMVLRTHEVPLRAAHNWPGGLPPPFVDRTSPELRELGILVAENPDALPRAYVATNARIIADENDTLEALVAPEFEPARDVILNVPLSAPPEPAPQAAQLPESRAVIEEYLPERVRVRVDTGEPGYLVLTDAWYPGWQATVNGRTQPIARANVLFRAVAVPAGVSEIVFEFRPAVQHVGAVVSLVGLLACVLIASRHGHRYETAASANTLR